MCLLSEVQVLPVANRPGQEPREAALGFFVSCCYVRYGFREKTYHSRPRQATCTTQLLGNRLWNPIGLATDGMGGKIKKMQRPGCDMHGVFAGTFALTQCLLPSLRSIFNFNHMRVCMSVHV